MAGKKVPDIKADSVGKTVCPKCGQTVDVSARKAFAIADCPHCGGQFATPGRLGQFVLLKALGSGGMGATFKAYEKSLDRHVAIKILHAPREGDSAKYVERFFSEARALASVDHPNVARAYSVGESMGQPFLVMELIIGNALDQLFKVATPLDEVLTLEIGAQVSRALRAAHKIGLIHGDVKPANILVAADGNAKLVDFGIARFGGGRITSEDALGTPYYLSPEQVRRQTLDFRTDIYSLGATLFHALSGKPPFGGKHAKDVMLARLEGAAPYLLAARPSLRRSTADVIRRMMQADPDERYGDYDELVRDLSRAAEVARTGGEGGPRPLATHELNAPGFEDECAETAQATYPGRKTPRWRSRAMWAAVAVLVLAAAGVGLWAALFRGPKASSSGARGAAETRAAAGNPVSLPRVENPVFSPAPRPLLGAIKVAVTCPTDGAVIRYTVNGTEPNERSSIWGGSATVQPGTFFRIRAYRDGYKPSETVDARYERMETDLAALEQLSAESARAWDGIKGIDRGQGFAARLDECNGLIGRARRHFGRNEYASAEPLFEKVIASCKQIASLESARGGAAEARREAEQMRKGIGKATRPGAAHAAYRKEAEAAGKAYESGKFAEARQLWVSAKGRAQDEALAMVSRAKKACLAVRDKYDTSQLKTYGGAPWRQFSEALADARRAEANLTPVDVVEKYRRAAELLPKAAAEAEKGAAAAKVAAAATAKVAAELERKVAAIRKEARKLLSDKEFYAALAKAQSALVLKPADPKAQALVTEIKRNFTLTVKLNETTTMDFVLIRPGVFKMGSPESEKDRKDDERQHDVRITKSFYMSTTEVTVGQFLAFAEDGPRKYRTRAERGDGADVYVKKDNKWQLSREKKTSWRECGFPQQLDHPVVCISWYDAKDACRWLTRKAGMLVRLPTEAEWEYACRAGTTSRFIFGDEENELHKYGNFTDKRSELPHRMENVDDQATWTAPVRGRYRPNAWGLHGMLGNAAEWCDDGGGTYSARVLTKDPRHFYTRYRAVRGGAWDSPANDCRSACRRRAAPAYRNSAIGFRVVVEIKEIKK